MTMVLKNLSTQKIRNQLNIYKEARYHKVAGFLFLVIRILKSCQNLYTIGTSYYSPFGNA